MTNKRGPYFTLNKAREVMNDTSMLDNIEEIADGVLISLDRELSDKYMRRRVVALLTQARQEWQEAHDAARAEVQVAGVLESPEDTRMHSIDETYVFTSAQANTFLNEAFWASLQHLVADRGATLHISRFTYNKQRFGKNSVKPGTHEDTDEDDLWFDDRIKPFISDTALQIMPDLLWCGDLNLLPTKVDPIQGFESHGRGASVIIPHTRMAMKSIPTTKNDPARFGYSTGTITARNYIEKAAGQKASLHHVYGALLVEVDRDTGEWWARQINADSEGTIYDLTDKYTPQGKETGQRVRAITHGDIHGNKFNRNLIQPLGYMIDFLRPEHQFFHDTIDFQPRNHHNIKDPHFLHDMWAGATESVAAEFRYSASLLNVVFAREFSKHYIITSNHDQAIEQWLRNTAGFYDPVNQMLWLDLNARGARCRINREKPRHFAERLTKYLDERFDWRVVDEDESLIFDGIEYGLHGHLGPNGSRGSPKNLRVVGKANTAHTHSAGIVEGVYTAGVLGNLDMGYNKGPSSWSHSSVITYPNGKRAIITFSSRGNPWR